MTQERILEIETESLTLPEPPDPALPEAIALSLLDAHIIPSFTASVPHTLLQNKPSRNLATLKSHPVSCLEQPNELGPTQRLICGCVCVPITTQAAEVPFL